MDEFPNEVELKAANALLLLSHSPTTPLLPPPSRNNKLIWKETCSSMEKSLESKKLRETKTTTSCNSTLTTEISFRSPCCMTQVARRARSKVIYLSSSDRKPTPSTWSKPPVKGGMSSQTTTDVSCLSTGGTSEISSGTKRRSGSDEVEQKNRRRVGSTYIPRRAEAIIRVLSGVGCASEVRIRQILGDSPDTSKALRMLLRMDKVKRRGAGGRNDPYIYTVAATTVDCHA